MDWICEAMAKPPLILTHYDARLENFVFSEPSATELALIDWQLMARLRPGWDIAYFLGTSVPTAERRLWQADLMRATSRAYTPTACAITIGRLSTMTSN